MLHHRVSLFISFVFVAILGITHSLADEASSANPAAAGGVSAPAASGDYEFLPPSGSMLRIYRVNRATGEMGACEFLAKPGTVGSTVCYPAGDGAGAQPAGVYALVASNLSSEGGIIRVNRQTGDVSICYVLNNGVVCTAPAH